MSTPPVLYNNAASPKRVHGVDFPVGGQHVQPTPEQWEILRKSPWFAKLVKRGEIGTIHDPADVRRPTRPKDTTIDLDAPGKRDAQPVQFLVGLRPDPDLLALLEGRESAKSRRAVANKTARENDALRKRVAALEAEIKAAAPPDVQARLGLAEGQGTAADNSEDRITIHVGSDGLPTRVRELVAPPPESIEANIDAIARAADDEPEPFTADVNVDDQVERVEIDKPPVVVEDGTTRRRKRRARR